MPGKSLLEVHDLHTYFFTAHKTVKAVCGASFCARSGQVLGIVGESGSGKTVTALSVLGLIDSPGKVVKGEIIFDGQNLAALTPQKMRSLRGREIALVCQDSLSCLNPVFTIGTQLIETIQSHENITKKEARHRSTTLLSRVSLPYPDKIMQKHPFELSGGMRQRVAIALALAVNPRVLIADEPTTALDVTVQAQILDEFIKLKDNECAIIIITHDLGVIAEIADEVAVMYQGNIVEYNNVWDIFDRPKHPYTRTLVSSQQEVCLNEPA